MNASTDRPPFYAFSSSLLIEKDAVGLGLGLDLDLGVGDLRQDAQLCTLLQNFSNHVQERASRLSVAVEELDRRVNSVDTNADRVLVDYIRSSDYRAMRFDISDHVCRTTDNTVVDHPLVGCSTSTPLNQGEGKAVLDTEQSLREEEYNAIQDGIAALSYFHDQSKSNEYELSDHYFGLEEEGADSAYYYESAKADVFNQRPLPFVIGSKAFMESESGGIGNEDDSSTPSIQDS